MLPVLMSLTAVSQLGIYYCRSIFVQVEEDIVWLDVFVDINSAHYARGGLIDEALPV
jgi:hypothetical protein